MTHEQIKSAFNEIYNNFYLKNRNKDGHERTDEEWKKIIEEAQIIQNKYEGNLAKSMVISILEEFENEDKNKL